MFESRHTMKIKPHSFCKNCVLANYKKKRTQVERTCITRVYECKHKRICLNAVNLYAKNLDNIEKAFKESDKK